MVLDSAATEPALYRDLMRFKPADMTPNGWAVRAGVSRTVWADMRRHGNPSRKTLERLLGAAGSSLAEFEALRLGEAPFAGSAGDGPSTVGDLGSGAWRPAPRSPLPLLATELGGEWPGGMAGIEQLVIFRAQHIGHIARPESLAADRNAYALTIIGDAMWPRFRSGRRLIVSPLSPIVVGDDVVVELVSEFGASPAGDSAHLALVKELVRRTPSFVELKQFNPAAEFRVEASSIAAIHRIIGEAY